VHTAVAVSRQRADESLGRDSGGRAPFIRRSICGGLFGGRCRALSASAENGCGWGGGRATVTVGGRDEPQKAGVGAGLEGDVGRRPLCKDDAGGGHCGRGGVGYRRQH